MQVVLIPCEHMCLCKDLFRVLYGMTEFEIKSALKKTRGDVQAAAELLASVGKKRDHKGEEKGHENRDGEEKPGDPEKLALSLIPKNGWEPPKKRGRTEEPTIEEYREIAGNTPPDVIRAANAEESGPTQEISPDDPPSMQHMNTVLEKYLLDDPKLTAEYRGNYIMSWGWLLWLQENLPNDTLCVYTSKTNHGDHLLLMDVEPIKRRDEPTPDVKKGLYISPEFYTQIEECRAEEEGPRFVIGILSLPKHCNGLVFDFEKRAISRFEPHGGREDVMFRPAIIDSAIRAHLIQGEGVIGYEGFDEREKEDWEKNMFRDWTYNSPIDFCPSLGVQTKAERSTLPVIKNTGGYCMAWSMIFMHQRVLSPDKTERQVVQYFLDMEPDDLLVLIRKYAAFMVSVAEGTLSYEQVYKQNDWVGLVADFAKEIYGYARIESYDEEKRLYGIVVFDWSRNQLDLELGRHLFPPDYLKPVTDKKVLKTLEKNYNIKRGDIVEYRIDNRLDLAGRVLGRSYKDDDGIPVYVVLVKRVYQDGDDRGQQIQVEDRVRASILNLTKRDFEVDDDVDWVTADENVRVDRGWGEIEEKIGPHTYSVNIRGLHNSRYVANDNYGTQNLHALDLTLA